MDALDQEMIAHLEVSHVIPIVARSRRRRRHSPRSARPGAERIGAARHRRVEPLCLALAAFRAISDLIEVSSAHTRTIWWLRLEARRSDWGFLFAIACCCSLTHIGWGYIALY